MIQLKKEYFFNSGSGTIIFEESENHLIVAHYRIEGNNNSGSIIGELSNNVFVGQFQIGSTKGLIEIRFSENGFIANWKQGIEKGPMKGKWEGEVANQKENDSNCAITSEKSAQKFMDFVRNDYLLTSEYSDRVDRHTTSDFVEYYSLEFEHTFFEALKGTFDILVFTVDNSEYSIDEHDGRDQYTIYYDILNKCIYKQFPTHSDDCYSFLGTWHASIPSSYKEEKRFLGYYKLTDLENKWEVSFQGNFESYQGQISTEMLEKLKQEINAESMYLFLLEVLDID